MPQRKQPCKNHPHLLTARKCYHCHDPICTNCEMTIEHHRFCGYYCYGKWKVGTLFGSWQFSRENVLLFAFILLVNLILFSYLNLKVNRLTDPEQTTKAPDFEMTDAQTPPPVQMDTIRYPLQNILQVKLKLRPGSVVALSREQEFIESRVQKNGSVTFNDLFLYSGKNRFAVFQLQNGGHTQLIDSFSIDIQSGRIDYLKIPVDHVSTQDKVVALTFDGGSLNNGTDRILDILRENGVRCSIFLTGSFLKKYPEQVLQMTEDGHEVGNHSFSHPHLTEYAGNYSNRSLPGVDRTFLYGELLQADSVFYALTGHPMAPLWRAPFGEINKDILLWAAELGFKHIGWSGGCDTRDWVADTASVLYRSSAEIVRHLLKVEETDGLNGKIILMHLSTDRKNDQPYSVLPNMIEAIKGRGYRFVTISQLFTQS